MCVDHLDPKQMQMFTSEDERGKEKRDLQREVIVVVGLSHIYIEVWDLPQCIPNVCP